MKLWGGRFSQETDKTANDFQASIGFDQRLYREDIEGSLAHAAMLARQGIISPEDERQIRDGLNSILADIEAGKLEFSEDNEDIHMNIETFLTQRVGSAGKRLHTARSRNDQVALDMRLYTRRTIGEIAALVLDAIDALLAQAREHLGSVMPAYTHLQRAQPVTFAHYMLAWAQMLRRDYTRLCDCRARMNECPLGAGACASTTYPLDRASVADALGFDRPTANSIDSVSDRDYLLELCSDLSILMMHLSRMCEELCLWCSWEFRFVEMDEAYSTGSSIMPQKKNPDMAELIRGKTGRVYGDLMGLLTVMKALPLAYNKDMQEDKEAAFDAMDTAKNCLRVFAPMVRTMRVRTERLRAAAGEGFINATDAADYLVRRGIPFRDAYTAVGKLVAACVEAGTTLENLPLSTLQSIHPAFGPDVYDAISLDACVNGRKVPGGPAEESVRAQIAEMEAFLAENRE
ncbi:MAG: argininosuccinate lyase [Eubacteriales bacterium]|nr:argininosuccinate lyase [Clostridiales bacterium]MDY3071633.1 argininosuccinate lyase [Eubacteriales bacterium]